MPGDKILEDGRSTDANLGVLYSYTCFSLDHFSFHSPGGITLMFKDINSSTSDSLVFPYLVYKEPFLETLITIGTALGGRAEFFKMVNFNLSLLMNGKNLNSANWVKEKQNQKFFHP